MDLESPLPPSSQGANWRQVSPLWQLGACLPFLTMVGVSGAEVPHHYRRGKPGESGIHLNSPLDTFSHLYVFSKMVVEARRPLKMLESGSKWKRFRDV